MTTPRQPYRITELQYSDLWCEAFNDKTGATQKIFDRMSKDPGFEIIRGPIDPILAQVMDLSIHCMYPHAIQPLK